MTTFLVEHAEKNVWCSPGLDNQCVFHPKKITPRNGGYNFFTLMGRPADLPSKGKYYHVFQVGQLDPVAVGLFNRKPSWTVERWIPFIEAVTTLNVEVTAYNQNGVVLPRYKSYFMFTKEKALLFAVEIDKRYPVDWYEDRFYFRFYTNAYLKVGEGSHEDLRMLCQGGDPETTTSILYLQTEVANLASKQGVVRVYRNGVLVPKLDLTTIAVGDSVEWVYDSSVKRTLTFTAKDLHSFMSKLDSDWKYLLHPPGPFSNSQGIDYQDDLDIYVLTPASFNRQMGVYFNRNLEKHHRMVTHRDYSISAEVFKELARGLAAVSEDPHADIMEFRVLVYVREGGYNRSLIYDNNRIFELYKLPDTEVVQALIGLNSTVPGWSADNLENCAYTRIMRVPHNGITIQDVEEGYGYNSISKILADSPLKTSLYSGVQRAQLPYLLQQHSTVYEFDSEGKLLGWRYHVDDNDYDATSANCELIEGVPGRGTQAIDVKYGKTNLEVPVNFKYRVYMCREVEGVPDEEWVDITDQRGQLYVINGQTLEYIGEEPDRFLAIKTDKTFLAYDFELEIHEGLLMFSLLEDSDLWRGFERHFAQIPGAQLDIWLNGYALIPKVDYILDFPVVTLLNKRYLDYPLHNNVQKLHIRMIGFCDKDMKMLPVEEHGFVAHGALSNNNRFDVRDDKVLRIVLGGKTKHRDELKFYEDSPVINVTHQLNGLPYQIKSPAISLRDFVATDTAVLRARSKDVDKRVSDYLTTRINTDGPPENFAVVDKYPVVSPFFAHLIYLLSRDMIEIPQTKVLTDTDILGICKPYEGLLAYDPVNELNLPDLRFCYIVPHYFHTVQTIGLYEYRFLLRVVKLYADGLIDLTPFLNYRVE